MPNWVYQDLHVTGSREDIDRFFKKGFAQKAPGERDDLLHFRRVCPLNRGERKDVYTHESGVVLRHFRTHTQALFSMITSWDYPAEFYKRLPTHWPGMAFVCTVNEDMGQFGGIVLRIDGKTINLVREYDGRYDPRAHRRDVKAALKDWFAHLLDGRDWRLLAATARRRSVPFDAHFDGDDRFYFRTREDVVRFKARYQSGAVMKRSGRTWRPTRV